MITPSVSTTIAWRKPNWRIDSATASTALSLIRGFLSYGLIRSSFQSSIFMVPSGRVLVLHQARPLEQLVADFLHQVSGVAGDHGHRLDGPAVAGDHPVVVPKHPKELLHEPHVDTQKQQGEDGKAALDQGRPDL